ncbi:hypothetical protein ACFFX0_25525 [Citricoccus parietis]|uniref:Uncharacterized protein n=1 Tax=Citricoccus parietis TaxID=592307 RepID=A0ABV5G5Z3_9MICC
MNEEAERRQLFHHRIMPAVASGRPQPGTLGGMFVCFTRFLWIFHLESRHRVVPEKFDSRHLYGHHPLELELVRGI